MFRVLDRYPVLAPSRAISINSSLFLSLLYSIKHRELFIFSHRRDFYFLKGVDNEKFYRDKIEAYRFNLFEVIRNVVICLDERLSEIEYRPYQHAETVHVAQYAAHLFLLHLGR